MARLPHLCFGSARASEAGRSSVHLSRPPVITELENFMITPALARSALLQVIHELLEHSKLATSARTRPHDGLRLPECRRGGPQYLTASALYRRLAAGPDR